MLQLVATDANVLRAQALRSETPTTTVATASAPMMMTGLDFALYCVVLYILLV